MGRRKSSRRSRIASNDTPKLNLKKVFATILVFVVFIMIIISLNKMLNTQDKKTKEVSTLPTYITVCENNKWGVIDNKGNLLLNLDYDEMIVIPDKNEGIFICNYDIDYENNSYKTKVFNEEGKEIFTEFDYIEAIENSDGNNIWYESNVLKYKKDNKYGLIDFSGKELLPAEYDNIYALEGIEKSIIIEKNSKKGLLSASTGEVIIDPIYLEISSISKTYENGYIVKNESNKFGVIAPDKTQVLEEKYDDVKKVCGNNYYVVVENAVLEIIDNSGNVILNSGFDSVEDILVDNFIIVKDSKYGIINKLGENVISPEYDNLKFSITDCYIASKAGKDGIINNNNEILIDFIYDKIVYVKAADFFEAEKEDYTTDIIDRNFNTVLNSIIISELNTDNGYIRLRENNEYKYYNFKFEEKTNKEVLATNTLFLVKENGKYGYENKNGDRIVDCIYDDAKEQNEYGYCAVNKNGLWGALKSDGTVIVEPTRNLNDYIYIDFISEWNHYKDLSLNMYVK